MYKHIQIKGYTSTIENSWLWVGEGLGRGETGIKKKEGKKGKGGRGEGRERSGWWQRMTREGKGRLLLYR